MTNKEKESGTLLLIIPIVFGLMLFSFVFGRFSANADYNSGVQSMERAAIKAGVATYVPGEDGSPMFKFDYINQREIE